MRVFLAALLAMGFAAAQADEVYRWKDEQGKWHYGDSTRSGAERVTVQPDSGGGPDPETLKQAEARAAECEKKKGQLEGYRNADVIKETDGLGREREYTPEERAMLIAKTEKEAETICRAPPPKEAAAASE